MNINNYIRRMIVELYKPRPPKPPKKPLGVVLAIRKIIKSIIFVISTAIKILLLIPFIVFSVIWLFIIISMFNGHYLAILGEDATLLISMIGIGVIPTVGAVLYSRNEAAVNSAFRQVYSNFQKTRLYEKFGDFVFKVTTFYFKNIMLPNIDLIEPGLVGQGTETFPEIVVYENTSFRKIDRIKTIISNNSIFTGALYIMSIIVLLIFVPIILQIVRALLNLVTFGAITPSLDFMIGIFLFCAYISMILLVFIPFHPKSIFRNRIRALNNELEQLLQEEQLLKMTTSFQNEAKSTFESYSQQLDRVRTTLSAELSKLDELKKEELITKENIVSLESFIATYPRAALLFINQIEERREFKERQTRWKEKAFDILVVTIILGLFVNWLSKMLFD